MSTREERIAEYERELTEIYATELRYLAERLRGPVRIVNTGGGCMAIHAPIGEVAETSHTLELLATTADPGLAEQRSDIVHWLVGLYDVDEGGEALAEGHDVDTFEAAYALALDNLRNGVPPADQSCACFDG